MEGLLPHFLARCEPEVLLKDFSIFIPSPKLPDVIYELGLISMQTLVIVIAISSVQKARPFCSKDKINDV
jgi:hypothetical protein